MLCDGGNKPDKADLCIDNQQHDIMGDYFESNPQNDTNVHVEKGNGVFISSGVTNGTVGVKYDIVCMHETTQNCNGTSDCGTDLNGTTHVENVSSSFASILKSDNEVKVVKKINFRTLVNEENVESYDCVLPPNVADVVKVIYENTLVGHFVEGLEQVLQSGPWIIRKSPIILTKWSSSMSLKKGEVTKVPVWVKMHNVPLLAYSEDGLSLIATQIGKPIMLDAFTSSMCVESWGRIGFARAIIEVSLDSELKKEVIMAIPNEEGNWYIKEVIRVEYEWKPPHCVECKSFGHSPTTCPNHVNEVVPKDMDDASNLGANGNTKGSSCQPIVVKASTMDNSVSIKNSFDALMDNSYEANETNKQTLSEWAEDVESDDEVDEVLYPEGNKFEDQFDIRLKGRARK
ncbi:hypothetical protein Tco_1431138 [Tanacetum coccineum]